MPAKVKIAYKASSILQKEINISIILNYLRDNSLITRAKLSRDLNISAPTVSKIIEKLLADNYVIEDGREESSGGKRALKLKFNSKIGRVIGVDLGKERISLGSFNFAGNKLMSHIGQKIYFNDKRLLEKVINEISNFINISNSNKKGVDIDLDLKAISLGVPAAIDNNSGEIVGGPLFEGWEGLKLKDILFKEFKIPIFIENSTNVSAIGELYSDKVRLHKNEVFLEISEGIGAGIIIDNQIFRGYFNSSGEVGFIITDLKDLYKVYKNKGYMENILTPRSIINAVVKKIEEGKRTIISEIISNDFNKIDCSIIFRAASLDDSLAKKIINNVIENLSLIVLNLYLILNPQVIIIGGELSTLPEINNLVIDPLKKIIEKIVPFSMPDIELSKLGNDAGVVGAAFFAIENLITEDFPYII